MRNFQDTFETRKLSFISASSIFITATSISESEFQPGTTESLGPSVIHDPGRSKNPRKIKVNNLLATV